MTSLSRIQYRKMKNHIESVEKGGRKGSLKVLETLSKLNLFPPFVDNKKNKSLWLLKAKRITLKELMFEKK